MPRLGQRRAPRVPYAGPRPDTLGVDVGGVLVVLAEDDVDTSFFGTRPLETPMMPGAFTRLAELTTGRFQGRVHVVSKAGPKVERHTRDWLHHHDFFTRTGVPPANLHFVRERRDKATVCARLGLTHFVDDRLDVLTHLTTVPHRYLMGTRPVPPGITPVPGWDALAHALH